MEFSRIIGRLSLPMFANHLAVDVMIYESRNGVAIGSLDE
jgi:hypothetical protein